MGVGKTTIGRILAQELGLEFIDSDQEIERRAGADISWIFDVEGEEGFRIRESAVIDELTSKCRVLIATGGGSVLRLENRKWLVSRGIVVFLDTTVELQLKRTEKDKRRPLLQNSDHAVVLNELRVRRTPIYHEMADISIFVGEESGRRAVKGIVKKLKEQALLKD